jgi:hypothetical protein
MKILNLTQHVASKEQIEAGVVEPQNKKAVQGFLTFVAIPTKEDIGTRAHLLAEVAKEHGHPYAMIGGAPYLMSALEGALRKVGVEPLYSFTERVSIEETQADGSVKKTSAFKHVCFIEV